MEHSLVGLATPEIVGELGVHVSCFPWGGALGLSSDYQKEPTAGRAASCQIMGTWGSTKGGLTIQISGI